MLICVLWLAPAFEVSASGLSRNFMSWRLISQGRVSDGGTSAVYELILPEQARRVENLEVYYVAKPWERIRRSRRIFGPAEAYTKELSGDPSRPRLSLYYGRSAQIEIIAGALIDGRFHSTRTLLNTYGNSDLEDPEARRVSAPPVWPGLRLTRTGFYPAMTGVPVYFELEADHRGPAAIRAFEQGREVSAELIGLGSDAYSYTPPLDPMLSAPGYSVKKDLTLVAALGDQGGVLSYYIPVNRSYYGHLYLRPGLLVVGLAALVSLGAVKLAGRRFKWS